MSNYHKLSSLTCILAGFVYSTREKWRERKRKRESIWVSITPRLNHRMEMPSVGKEQRGRGPERFLPKPSNDLDMYDIISCPPEHSLCFIWLILAFGRLRAPNKFYRRLWQTSFFIYCRLWSGVRDTAFDRWWRKNNAEDLLSGLS